MCVHRLNTQLLMPIFWVFYSIMQLLFTHGPSMAGVPCKMPNEHGCKFDVPNKLTIKHKLFSMILISCDLNIKCININVKFKS